MIKITGMDSNLAIQAYNEGAFENMGEKLLAQGQSIVYWDKKISDKYAIEEYPDGKMFFLDIDKNGNTFVVGEVPNQNNKKRVVKKK